MSGGPDSPGNRPPANSPGSVAEPGTSPGPGCTCQARIFWETNLGGLRSLGGPALPLSRMAGASALAPAGQEAPQEKTCSGRKPGRRMPRKIWRARLSPFAGLDSLGWGQRPPSPWAVVGALAVGLLACLFMLFSIQAHLESLREDLAALRRERLCQASGTPEEDRDAPNSRQRAVRGPAPPAPRTRRTRDVGKAPQDPLACQRKKHSVLHLVPARHYNTEEGDATEIWWSPFLKQGRALEPSGQDVVVRHTGLYFVYSQVLFHDPTFTMGQVLRRVALGKPDQILFRCVQSMPPKVEKAYNSCYSGGVFQLHQGDRLSLRIPRFNASFDISTHGTFLGVLRL